MTFAAFDFTPLLAPGLPPAAARWNGRVKFDFTGGNNDPDRLPLEGLIAAAESVLRREGRKLAIYGVDNGPQGYRPLRDFLVGKLKTDAGIACTADDIVEHLKPLVAKWWLPDAVEFVDDIPHTATGKISKKDLRDRFADYTLAT